MTRLPFRLLTLLLVMITGAWTVSADSVLMVLEQDQSGASSQQALDVSQIGDGIDPVATHIALNAPTDPRTSQVLWEASDTPVIWDLSESNDYRFIEHATLPAGGKIQYRVYLHKFNLEVQSLRHERTHSAGHWGLNADIFRDMTTFEYVLEAHIIVPDRPKQILRQRLNVRNSDNQGNGDATPTPDPDPDPDPDTTPIDGEPPALAEGFTELVKDSNTNIIYASSSLGNDANDGRSPETAVKTLARGVELLRDGNPDWLLLKAGDVWLNQSFVDVSLGGESAGKPLVISTYGEGPRPLIIPADGQHGYKSVKHQIDGLVIQGLHFYAATRDPASPVYKSRPGDVDGINIRIPGGEGYYIKGLLIEDCVVTNFDSNIKVVDDWSRKQGEGVPGRINVNIRRNIIRFASSDDSHSIGIYIEGTVNSVIEQNLIDHNGWALSDSEDKRNKASHNIYAQWANGPLTVRHNIITRAAAHGLQLRAGGNIEHNLFVRNPMAFFTALNSSKANYNVILEGDDMDTDVPEDRRGYGINGWDMAYYEVIGNIVARRVGSLERAGIDIAADELVVRSNKVYDWQDKRINSSIIYHSSDSSTTNNRAKEFYGGNEPNYLDPSRGLATYAGSIGLEPTNEGFINYAASRPRGTWPQNLRPNIIADYVREGFEIE